MPRIRVNPDRSISRHLETSCDSLPSRPVWAKGAIWRLQWRGALARRRLFIWNVAVPFLLLAPVGLSRAATPHRAAVFAIFFVLFGAFGSCIPLVLDAQRGWTLKLLLTGYPERAWLGERCAAESVLDIVQLLPTVLLYLVVGEGGQKEWLGLLAALILAVVVANLLGVLVAAAVRSIAEGALASAAVVLVALHLTGVFRVPVPSSWAWTASQWSPLRPLYEFLRAGGAGRSGAPELGIWWLPVLSSSLLVVLMIWFAPVLARRLCRVPEAD